MTACKWLHCITSGLLHNRSLGTICWNIWQIGRPPSCESPPIATRSVGGGEGVSLLGIASFVALLLLWFLVLQLPLQSPRGGGGGGGTHFGHGSPVRGNYRRGAVRADRDQRGYPMQTLLACPLQPPDSSLPTAHSSLSPPCGTLKW